MGRAPSEDQRETAHDAGLEVTGTAGSKLRSVSPAIAGSKSPAITTRRSSGPASFHLRDVPLQARFTGDVAFDVRAASRASVSALSFSALCPRRGSANGSPPRRERLDDPPEFVERAAEALTILL